MSLVLRRLFITNPILEEATRARRKFFRVSGGPGRGLARAAILIIILIYLWIVGQILLSGSSEITTTILFMQLIVVTLAMPVSVYGAIAGERERTTWEALILTRLTPGQIVAGKMLWRMGGLSLLMAAFVPPLLTSVDSAMHPRYQPGGSIAGELLLAEGMTFAWGFVLCAFGLWVSANTRRSVTSAALIFITLLALLALLPALASMLGGPSGMDMADFSGNYPVWALMHINAFYALSKVTERYYDDTGAYQSPDPLHGTGWGLLQIAIYLIGAAAFLYVTYRSLKIWEEPRHRLG